MAWTAPLTWVANTVLTAAQLNQQLRDNLLETAPAKATAAGRIFVSTGVNAIVERAILGATITTTEDTTSSTFVDLTTVGPTVSVTTGTRALVMTNSGMRNAGAGNGSQAGYAISTSSIVAAGDRAARHAGAAGDNVRIGITHLHTDLTSGSNTFQMKYRSTSGTIATFFHRTIQVIGL